MKICALCDREHESVSGEQEICNECYKTNPSLIEFKKHADEIEYMIIEFLKQEKEK